MKKKVTQMSKEEQQKRQLHVTRPPRLEGKAKNAMMNPVRKQKRSKEAPIKAKKAE